MAEIGRRTTSKADIGPHSVTVYHNVHVARRPWFVIPQELLENLRSLGCTPWQSILNHSQLNDPSGKLQLLLPAGFQTVFAKLQTMAFLLHSQQQNVDPYRPYLQFPPISAILFHQYLLNFRKCVYRKHRIQNLGIELVWS